MQQDPLAALHPLREPEAIAWWPPAPGWWLLVVLALAAAIYLAAMIYRRYRSNAYRRQGAAQLKQLYLAYEASGDDKGFVTDGNALLKSVAMQAYPAHEVASAYGEAWVRFLNESAGGGSQFDQGLADTLYRQEADQLNIDAFNRAAQHWIIHHRRQA